MSEMSDFKVSKNYQWRKMAKNGDGEFALFISQIRHFAIPPTTVYCYTPMFMAHCTILVCHVVVKREKKTRKIGSYRVGVTEN